jgi:hypothetical protein
MISIPRPSARTAAARHQPAATTDGAPRADQPSPPAAVVATVTNCLNRRSFTGNQLRRLRDSESAVALYTLFTGTASDETMKSIRAAMISSALLGDAGAVGQWAQAGLTRCRQLPNGWPATAPEWRWVLDNAAPFVALVQKLARGDRAA